MICSSMVVHCTDEIPLNDIESLYGGVEAFGGQWRDAFEVDVTHVVATSMNDKVYAKALSAGMTVVLPHYFEDCFRIGRLCPIGPYVFPNPKILSLKPCDLLTAEMAKQPTITKSQVDGINPFKCNTVFLDQDLDNSVYIKLLERLRADDINVVESFHDASVVVTEFRDSASFKWGIERSLIVGTPRWATDIMDQKSFIDPQSRPLYYPRPREPIPEMAHVFISVTNYINEARHDICTMALHVGAKFSYQLSPSNTHLICASPAGNKFSKAMNWNVHLVNHLWLEESYAKWVYQREGRPSYVYFPPGLETLVNSTPISPFNALVPRSPLAQSSKAPTPTHTKTRDLLNEPPVKAQDISSVISIDKPPSKIEKVPPKVLTPRMIESDSFQNSRKRLASDIPTISKHPRRDPILTSDPVYFTLTGCKDSENVSKMSLGLKNLNMNQTEDISKSTHLIALKGARTEKFLRALLRGIPIVTPSWLQTCISKNRVVDPFEYLLKDTSFERLWGFSLSKSLESVRNRVKPLLDGYQVYSTPNITLNDAITRIVETAGGKCVAKVSKKAMSVLLANMPEKTIILSSNEDRDYFELFRSNRKRIHKCELLLTGILRQKLELDLPSFIIDLE